MPAAFVPRRINLRTHCSRRRLRPERVRSRAAAPAGARGYTTRANGDVNGRLPRYRNAAPPLVPQRAATYVRNAQRERRRACTPARWNFGSGYGNGSMPVPFYLFRECKHDPRSNSIYAGLSSMRVLNRLADREIYNMRLIANYFGDLLLYFSLCCGCLSNIIGL